MAAGKPVICTSVGGIPELVTDGVDGLLVKKSDSDAFTAAMKHMITSPERLISMGRASAKKARTQFDTKVMVDLYENLYMDILEPRSFEHKTTQQS